MPAPDLRHKRAVIFDLDGTLYHQKPLRRAMALRLLRAHALRPVQGLHTFRFLSAYRRMQEELRNEPGAPTRQLEAACIWTGIESDCGAAMVRRWMDEEPLPLLARHRRGGLTELLADLRASGRKLGLLSDYPAMAKLRALGVADCFDAVLCAQDPNLAEFKPSPRGIVATLERLGAAPDGALYVGDRPEVDYAAAKAAGVDCAIFVSRQTGSEPFVPVASCAHLRSLLLSAL